MSKFADNLVDLAENTANYIRIIEEQNEMLREEKVYLLQKAGENIAEIAELQAEVQQYKSALIAYASEFYNDEEGLPDVGNIHKNIRTLKSQRNDLLSFAKFASDRASNFGDDWLWREANLVISSTSGD